MLTIHDTRAHIAETPCTTALLPIGAVEQHGSHLPVGTDILLAEAFARGLAGPLNAYLLPPVAVSASIEHRKAKGTVYLRAETLALVVRDIAVSLRESGFRRLVIANFHGGNWILKPTIRELNRDLAEFRVVLLQPDLPAADAREIFEHPVGDVHGGEYETSLMLHLYPQSVRPIPLAGERTFPPQPLLDYFDSTELTAEGYWGWPEAATAEKGRRAMAALIAASLRFIQQIDDMDRKVTAPKSVDVSLRPLREDDIPFANELREIAGWNQSEKDWRGYLRFEPEGCFLAEVRGRRAGTATTIRYGNRFGWIGMVLVHPDQRRFGVGTTLLRAAISHLKDSGVACIKLDATPVGRTVYAPMGFVDEYDLSRYEGTAPAVEGVTAQIAATMPFAAADFGQVAQLDASVFGAERAHVLQELSSRNPDLCFATRGAEGVTGYLIAREGARAVQIGPWSARDAAAAESLLLALFQRVAGRLVYIDVPAPNSAGSDLVTKYGFRVQRTLTRMFLGENTAPGHPQLAYSISSPEKG